MNADSDSVSRSLSVRRGQCLALRQNSLVTRGLQDIAQLGTPHVEELIAQTDAYVKNGDFDKAIVEYTRMGGGTANMFIDPDILDALLPVIDDALMLGLKTAKAGVYHFAEFVNELRNHLSDDEVKFIAPAIEHIWTQLSQADERMGPPGLVRDILDPKSADAGNEHQIG